MATSRDYSLTMAKGIVAFMNTIRNIQYKNSDIISITEDTGISISVKDNYPESEFYFTIYEPGQSTSGNLTFQINRMPSDNLSRKPSGGNTPSDYILKFFNGWVNVIREYNDVHITPEEKINAFYEKEFYADFEIVDDDADVNPFSSVQQEKLIQLLDNLQKSFEENKDKYELAEVIEETKELRKELPLSSKRKVIKKLSIIFGKLKKLGIDAVKELLKEAVKEGLKFLIKEGYTLIN